MSPLLLFRTTFIKNRFELKCKGSLYVCVWLIEFVGGEKISFHTSYYRPLASCCQVSCFEFLDFSEKFSAEFSRVIGLRILTVSNTTLHQVLYDLSYTNPYDSAS